MSYTEKTTNLTGLFGNKGRSQRFAKCFLHQEFKDFILAGFYFVTFPLWLLTWMASPQKIKPSTQTGDDSQKNISTPPILLGEEQGINDTWSNRAEEYINLHIHTSKERLVYIYILYVIYYILYYIYYILYYIYYIYYTIYIIYYIFHVKWILIMLAFVS